MRAGKLNVYLTIEQNTVTLDSYRQPTPNWSTFAQVWGEQIAISGREFVAAQQIVAEVTHLFKIRSGLNVTSSMRVNVEEQNKVYDILAVIYPDGRKRELHLLCKDGMSRGLTREGREE